MMTYRSAAITALFALGSLAGCSSIYLAPPQPGESEASIVARLGEPTHRYGEGNTHLLEYMTGPWGQSTFMARIGADGRLISYEQVLDTAHFSRIVPGKSDKQEVLHLIGAPSATSYLTLPQLEVWSYPYRESNAWDSVMHVHFDNAGIVRMLQNGPDRRRTPDMAWPMGSGL
ncbi:outer membrane protein assembly factor BamE [Noviherbaspirillum sp. L7-7A]|uniref:outer membrane protein assembly factor BamE domain-containing protein n=1 Tax=Noviherbaspirillum sp. L7-7A TaxID=2850560 RepID=UPI0020118AF6|nr:outer membrane protein assembly factor BamE [Noviherbaspirillum sp. L7-7A]